MQVKRRALPHYLFAVGLLMIGPVSAASLDAAIRDCRSAFSAGDKIAACNFVIARAPDGSSLAKAYNRRGLANVEIGRYAEAVRDFTEVIRFNPDVAGYYDNRQNALRQLGRLDEALRDANTAVRLAPGYTFVLRGRANIYDDMGRRDLAIADFTRAIALDAKDASLRADRAKLYVKIGSTGDAFLDLSHAIALDPANIGLRRDRGMLLAHQGNRVAARPDLTAYVSEHPEDAEAAQALAALDAAPLNVPPPPSTPQVSSTDQRQADAIDAKKKLVADAVAQHEDCLLNALTDIAPYSSENAPTLVDVAIDRCAKFAERRIAIGVGAYDMTRDDAKAIVDRKVAELRTKLITVVVTARAEAAKRSVGADQEAPRSEAPTTSQGLPKAQPL